MQHRVVGLIPGYIIILTIPAPQLLIYAIAGFDFTSHWRPLHGPSAITYLPITDPTPLVKDTPLLDNTHHTMLSINESPL
ncbi:hypothetical protein B0H19DRAFT_1270182 [Mycena capillaripes]|nr:hypothetical protein B0H19DRAFT_1270182 [Mycena capillaripes]